jgi:hypothetical protein
MRGHMNVKKKIWFTYSKILLQSNIIFTGMRATVVFTAIAICILQYYEYRSDLFWFELLMFWSFNFDKVSKATKGFTSIYGTYSQDNKHKLPVWEYLIKPTKAQQAINFNKTLGSLWIHGELIHRACI